MCLVLIDVGESLSHVMIEHGVFRVVRCVVSCVECVLEVACCGVKVYELLWS